MTRIVDWIEAKREGKPLTDEAIRAIVSGFTSGGIPDYQMSALLMAVVIRGMTMEETLALTTAMVESGEVLDLSSVPGVKLDKHSTGGVGDKITLALVPILAAAGVPMAKMSGHGLGLTGGTLDKLESIGGFRTELTTSEIVSQVRSVGACICSQSDSLAPADRAIYALRDVTGTVASVPLIASSILSKKIACGADAIVLDVKVGSGAFMKDIDQARELAQTCMFLAEAYGKRMSVFITDMDQPLGRAIGNWIEVGEVVSLLQGKSVDSRLYGLTMTLCQEALGLAGKCDDPAKIVESGAALEKFGEIIEAQGGDSRVTRIRGTGRAGCTVTSTAAGYVQRVDARKIAELAAYLGAGRQHMGDSVDPIASVLLDKVVGDGVAEGETIGVVHSSRFELLTPETEERLRDAFTIGPDKPAETHLILDHFASDRVKTPR
jgi:pyrimidine-nucleoside phosphorylase